MSEDAQVLIPPWKLAANGISMFINNQPDEAKQLFEQHRDNNIQMAAGLSFVTFMDALMSFEEEKLQEAFVVLNDTDKRCSNDSGWVKVMKTRMFGSRTQNLADYLEGQIIIADVQVCISILTFLQQDISSYLKGAWCLRKAWKIYQRAYTQVLDIYQKKIGPLNLPDPSDFTWNQKTNDGHEASTSSSNVDDVVNTKAESSKLIKPHLSPTSNVPSSITPSSTNTNGYIYNIDKPTTSQIPHSYSTHSVTTSPKKPGKLPRSKSSYENAKVTSSQSSYSFFTPITMQLSFLTESLSNLSLLDINPDLINNETILRLMGAVCFGYGLIQLCMSLLPPSLAKLTNLFGFSGNRADGVAHLMYSRKGTDMRAPLATLSLLMYHTIIRPFFAIDGTNVKAGLSAVNLLLEESKKEYVTSGLFLFFKGRMYRLNSNIPLALKSFEMSVENSNQREVKLLSLHEVGWCHLILLDYVSAQKIFTTLKTNSRWSRTFYMYILIICLGSDNKLTEYNLIAELTELLNKSNQKSSQLEIFLTRRLKAFPSKDRLNDIPVVFWRLFVYELLFLWNTLPSCDTKCNNQIIKDCDMAEREPMVGLAMLIQGECYKIQGAINKAIISYRKGLVMREKQSGKDDLHLSAYTEFELGLLLIKEKKTFAEGKSLINHSGIYKDYDFDNKLQVRIEQTLKHL